MKTILSCLLLLLVCSLSAQTKLNKPVVAKGKLPATTPLAKMKTLQASGKLKPSDRYKVNNSVLKALSSLPSKTFYVNGKKLVSKMISLNRPQAVTRPGSGDGVRQKSSAKGSSSSNGTYCQTYTVKVSAESESFDVPYGTQASHIYPGAAYMYDEYYRNTVSPKTITWPRNPLYIQIASSSGSGKYELVENPTQVNLQAAVGRLKSSLPSAATNESTSINMISVYDEADFYLKVNGGGGGFGFKADASFGLQTNSKKSYFLIDAVQTFYTLNASLPEVDSLSFFADPQKDKTKGALFMASVSYGRRVLGIVETEFKDEKMLSSFKASYSAGFAGGYASLDMLNGMQTATTKVRLYFVGGNATSIEVPNPTAASVQAAINNYMRNATSQNAVPIKFTFRDMSMSGMRYESATDNFTYQQCVPLAPDLRYNVSVTLQMIQNSKNEEVKFGINQYAKMYVGGKWKSTGEMGYPILSWMEGQAFKMAYKSEEPRTFKQSTQVNRTHKYILSQAELMDGYLSLETTYIAMYATRVFGQTNDSNPGKKERINLKDVITSGGGTITKDVQINFNGRVFTVKFIVSANPA